MLTLDVTSVFGVAKSLFLGRFHKAQRFKFTNIYRFLGPMPIASRFFAKRSFLRNSILSISRRLL